MCRKGRDLPKLSPKMRELEGAFFLPSQRLARSLYKPVQTLSIYVSITVCPTWCSPKDVPHHPTLEGAPPKPFSAYPPGGQSPSKESASPKWLKAWRGGELIPHTKNSMILLQKYIPRSMEQNCEPRYKPLCVYVCVCTSMYTCMSTVCICMYVYCEPRYKPICVYM